MRRIALLTFALVALVASVRAEDFSQYKTADELWAYFHKVAAEPRPVDHTTFILHMQDLHGALLALETRFPDDSRRWDAKLLRVRIGSALAQINKQPTTDTELLQVTKEIISAADASATTKADARYLAAGAHMGALELSTNREGRAAMEVEIAGIRKDYPDDQRTALLQYQFAEFLKLRDPDATEAILRELENSKNIQMAALAQQRMEALKTTRELAKKPLDLKFQATNGTNIDL